MNEADRSKSTNIWVLLLAAVLLIVILVAVLAGLAFRSRSATKPIAWADFKQRIEHGDFRTITVRDDGAAMELSGTLRAPPPQSVTARVPSTLLDDTGWKVLGDLASKANTELEFKPRSRLPLP